MEKLNEAVYLINDERYLHLRENSAGVGFATYNKVTGEPLESGQEHDGCCSELVSVCTFGR